MAPTRKKLKSIAFFRLSSKFWKFSSFDYANETIFFKISVTMCQNVKCQPNRWHRNVLWPYSARASRGTNINFNGFRREYCPSCYFVKIQTTNQIFTKIQLFIYKFAMDLLKRYSQPVINVYSPCWPCWSTTFPLKLLVSSVAPKIHWTCDQSRSENGSFFR